MVRVVNLMQYKLKDGEVLIKVDRSTPVGNPYYWRKDGLYADEAYYIYEPYFYKKVKEPGAFRNYVAYIYRTALKHDVALGCWHAPKRGHADVIATFINKFLSK